MTKKKYLSEKKTSQQTISLSPALKEWIERYVRVEHEKHPEDDRYKSISAFYCVVMENVLNIFKKGKTLDDFKIIPDSKIKKFYDKITFKALIPYYEEAIYLNKYQESYLKNMFNLMMMFKNQLPSGEELTMDNFTQIVERFKFFMLSNNMTKNLEFERINNNYTLQYFGNYPNSHFDFSKFIACALGILGFKIKTITYSKKFTRFDLKETYLITNQNPLVKERLELFNQNLKKFTNYYKLLNDEDSIHLWMKAAKYKNAIISFTNKDKSERFIKEIVKDIEVNSPFKERIPTIIRLFEFFRWIQLVDIEDNSFICNLSDDHIFEKDILKTTINNLKLNIEKQDNIFFLK
ncbi:MAG: hypothetical protein KGD63_01250 [Candidatus Lokiarchaeota archaeon]|nr:hypothetical protein [Candidatus Lokiarchaeota archaeon]